LEVVPKQNAQEIARTECKAFTKILDQFKPVDQLHSSESELHTERQSAIQAGSSGVKGATRVLTQIPYVFTAGPKIKMQFAAHRLRNHVTSKLL